MTIKIYELAKELNIASKELVEKINAMGIEAKSHMSSIDEKVAAELRNTLGGKHVANSETKVVKAVPKKKEKENDNEPRVTVKAANIKPPMPTKKAAPKKPAAHTEERPAARPPVGRPLPKNAVPQRKKPIMGTPVVNKELDEREKKASEAPAIKIEAEVIVKEEPKTEEAKVQAAPAAEPVKVQEPAKEAEIKKEEPKKETKSSGRDEKPAKRREDRGNQKRDDRPARKDDRFKKNDDRKKPDKDRKPAPRRDAAPAPDMGVQKPNQKKKDDKNRKNKEQHDKFSKLENGKQKKGGFGKDLTERSLEKKERKKHNRPKKEEPVEETIVIPEGSTAITVPITVAGFCEQLEISTAKVIMALMKLGIMANINQNLDEMTVEILAAELGIDVTVTNVEEDLVEEGIEDFEDKEEDLKPRPPIITVMGHVDHGKTSLLDAIRQTRVTDREAGGITQHIGASVVSINGQNITFLDTPGHEAFTAMRMRGANSTDIAILVVAADDGVMPQTVEAINHAKAAGVEIIVAVNKIDKPSANIDKVKQELSEYELIPEDWGGSTIFCPVSAHTKEGIDNLLEMILLTAEVLELKANPDRNARGLVIEAQLDRGRGAVATVLVQKGTLHVGDPIACGSSYGKVRAMIDDKGRRVKEAKPSTPVEILGLNSVPSAGETFVACDSEKEAKAFSDTYISEEKNKLIEDTKAKMSLDDLFSQIQSGNMKELDIIVKADVQGSVEAVKQSLVNLSNEEVVVKVIHGGVGAINESDVILASASNAIIIGFNVRPDPVAKATADREGVDIRLYKVIYNAIEDVSAAMKGMLDPVFEEKVIGHAEIRQIFKASGVGNIAGSYVLDGFMERGCRVRISREGEQIFEGDLASLKRFKDDVKEVKTGYECGLVFQDFNDVKEEDKVEAYIMVEVPR